MQWVWLIFIRIVLHCLPCLWLWLHHPCISTHSNVLGRKHFGNTQCLAGIETLSSITSAVKTSSKAQGSFAESCATSNYWKLVEEDERGVEMEELHCDHHSHPPSPMLHPSPCPLIGQLWSAGKTLASDWLRGEWGILENFARVAPAVLREVVELGTDRPQQCVGL